MGFTLNQLEQERQIRKLQKKEDKDTSNYEQLSNLPKINNVELKGDKTTSDLGINANNVMLSDGVTNVEEAVDNKITVNGTTCNMAIIPRVSVTFSNGVGSIDLSSHIPTGYRGSIGYAQANDTGSVAITGCARVDNTTGTYTVKAIAGGSAFTGPADINFIIALLPTS